MGDVINLRQARKARQRAEAAGIAEANRARHGRSKAEKAAAEAERKRADSVLDAARRERPPE